MTPRTEETTGEQVEAAERLGKVTCPTELSSDKVLRTKELTNSRTAIYICECYRLYPTAERVAGHRVREHGGGETEVITWNE